MYMDIVVWAVVHGMKSASYSIMDKNVLVTIVDLLFPYWSDIPESSKASQNFWVCLPLYSPHEIRVYVQVPWRLSKAFPRSPHGEMGKLSIIWISAVFSPDIMGRKGEYLLWLPHLSSLGEMRFP